MWKGVLCVWPGKGSGEVWKVGKGQGKYNGYSAVTKPPPGPTHRTPQAPGDKVKVPLVGLVWTGVGGESLAQVAQVAQGRKEVE